MYGADAYGSIPYADTSATVFDVDAMLSSSQDGLVYTVELTTWHTAESEEHVHHYATTEYVTEPTDYPANQPFSGRLLKFNFRRSILGATIGVFTTGDGTLVISNADGDLDDIVNTHAVDSREVVVRFGRITDPFVNHLVVFRGIAVDIFADADTATVTVRDFGYRLDTPAQPNVYAGTGGAEGGADLAGKRKPRVYGLAFGVPAILVNAASLIYQMSDSTSSVTDIFYIYDRGVVLLADADHADYAALVASSPGAGNFDTCRALGLLKLGAASDGLVFGSFGPSPSLSTAVILGELLSDASDLADAEIDASSFDAVAVAQSAEASYYMPHDEATSIADVIARLMAGIGGWGGFNRLGKLSLGIVAAPSGNPVAYFNHDEGDIISLNRERLPSGIWPPPWRWRVAHERSWTIFTDFAGSVDASAKAFYAQPYRLGSAEDTSILDDHPLAQDPPSVEAYFRNNSDAETEAARLLALYAAGYQLFRFTTDRRGLGLDIGDEINVTHPRFGLSAGRNMIVVEVGENIDLSDGSGVETVEIAVWG